MQAAHVPIQISDQPRDESFEMYKEILPDFLIGDQGGVSIAGQYASDGQALPVRQSGFTYENRRFTPDDSWQERIRDAIDASEAKENWRAVNQGKN